MSICRHFAVRFIVQAVWLRHVFFKVSLLVTCYEYNEFCKLNMKQVWNILYVLKNYSVVGQETYWAKPVVNSYYY